MGGRGVLAGGSAVVCLLALGLPAPAMGHCNQGTRLTTRGERQFYVSTLGALKAAMPAPPPGWRSVEETDVRGPRAMCVGREKRPLSPEFSVRYERAGQPDPGGSVQLASATSGGDAPGTARIVVIVNEERRVFERPAEPVQGPPGPLAFQRVAGGRTALDILLGDWSVFRSDDPADPLEVMAHFDVGLPYLTVQSLAIRLAGPAAPVALRRQQLDVARLGALVHQ
jgi:hypothetical protein